MENRKWQMGNGKWKMGRRRRISEDEMILFLFFFLLQKVE